MDIEIPRDELIREAKLARRNAYAPYSHFQVGAAVLDDNNRIHSGCNVENASYGLTNCAERVAVETAIANGARHIRAVAVISTGGVSPCGACRQVIAEFQTQCRVFIVDADTEAISEMGFESLLPHAFRRADLPESR